MVWYAKDPFETVTFQMRYFGHYGVLFWIMVACNCVIPLALFSPRVRRNLRLLWILSLFVNVGMWLERFVIIAGSLGTNFIPSQWGFFVPSVTEISITAASFAWFLMLFSLFTRFLPIVSMTELKEGLRWLRQALRKESAEAA
jgi:molybdopterin-containing oxidoreductase family membrane subunit